MPQVDLSEVEFVYERIMLTLRLLELELYEMRLRRHLELYIVWNGGSVDERRG